VTTERIGPPLIADERQMLRVFLDYHRATLAMKCDGLPDEDLRRQSMPPSTLSLLGLVRHMAEVEHSRRIEQAAPSLDLTAHNARWDEDVSLRLVMLHLIHEYARHNGHADFLREGIDGTVGV
jgi:hypothetical protein